MLVDISEQELDEKWGKVKAFFSDKFADGEKVDVDTILYLIGVQELGTGKLKFEKDEKVELMHMATCKLLEPFGYFEFTAKDPDGWSHFKQVESIGDIDDNKQFELLKKACVFYFETYVWS
ncbi:MAG: hypothetical protein KAH10_01975 [Flavobacteriales bacterium]|nr:hypothetical protein [Flavobacteriales bacterium]